MRQVGHRHALTDTPIEQRLNFFTLAGAELARVDLRCLFVLETRAEKHELRGFIDRIVGAVSEPDVRRSETLRAMAYEFFDSSGIGG